MRNAILVIAALLAAVNAYEEVCFEDLGCFSTAPPFTAPGRTAALPNDPRDLSTEFLLLTRHNSAVEQKIAAKDVVALRKSNFNGKNPTKLLLHGYLDRPIFGTWMKDMARQFLVGEDCNFIIVNWARAACNLYPKSAANSRVVGAQMGQLIEFLHNETGAEFSSFHIMGHSLGAHAAGYAGKWLKKRGGLIGRLTGLDPAGPFFQNVSAEVRLDASDAIFVDNIHADGADPWAISSAIATGLLHGMGMLQPTGHVDIYPNGGHDQPGCGFHPIYLIVKDGIVEGMRYTVACHHMRSYNYLFETVASSCPWRSYACESFEEFKTGRCLYCPATGDKTGSCNGVGYTVVKPSDPAVVNRRFFAITGDKTPFCRYHYHVQLSMKWDPDATEQKGKVWVKLHGNFADTDFIQLGTDHFFINQGGVYDFLITTKEEVRDISSIELKWEHDSSLLEIDQWYLFTQSIYLERVKVFSGEFQQEAKFCDNEGKLKSKSSRVYTTQC